MKDSRCGDKGHRKIKRVIKDNRWGGKAHPISENEYSKITIDEEVRDIQSENEYSETTIGGGVRGIQSENEYSKTTIGWGWHPIRK